MITRSDCIVIDLPKNRYVVQNPESFLPYQALASLYSNDLATQISIYRRGFDAIPDKENIGLLLATAYGNAGEYENRIEIYETILAINPDNIRAINNLAVSLLDHRSDTESHAEALRLATRFESSYRRKRAEWFLCSRCLNKK